MNDSNPTSDIVDRQEPHDQKSTQDILAVQIDEALNELRRETSGLFLSGLSAGLDMGFGPLLMAVLITLVGGVYSEPVKELLVANAYTVGFLFVILGRSELFTEHTTMAVLPVIDRRASLGELGRLWTIVYVANVIGGVIFTVPAVVIGPALGTVEAQAFVDIGKSLVEHDFGLQLSAAVLAGWLMGLLSWMLSAAEDTISRVFFVWVVTASIGIAHLPHSIAGNIEVLMAVLASSEVGWGSYGTFMVAATVGNAVGGSVFVALLKYGHVVRGGQE